jgi:hypothetical protein
MKKFALAAVAAAAMTAGVAQAYTVGTFSNGFVVPNVIHNGAANTTAVGIVNQTAATIPVFWTWFDQNSNHGVDGCFAMTPKQYAGINWSAVSGVGMEGRRGYMVFAVGALLAPATPATACLASTQALAPIGAATAQIAGNAFYVDIAGKSVAYTPVIDGPLILAAGTNLTTMNHLALQRVAGAASVAGTAPVSAEPFAIPALAGANANVLFGRANTTQVSLRYFIDGAAGGNDTRVSVWSTGNHSGTHTVNIYDNAQNRQSVNFPLTETELSWFDPETIAGRPAAFVDGFIEWNPSNLPSGVIGAVIEGPLATIGGDVVAYSTIVAPAFGAVQTLLGGHR